LSSKLWASIGDFAFEGQKMLIGGHNPRTFVFFIAFKETKVMALKPQVGS
jgi:hypothetical protein